MTTAKTKSNLLLRMHPLQRILLSLVFAAVVWFIIKRILPDTLYLIIATWCAFALSYVVTSWAVLISRKVEEIKKRAKEEDGSRVFVIAFTIIASFAAMVTVILLIISSPKDQPIEIPKIMLCFLSILLSWVLVHTILTFHYAHLYYDIDKTNKKQNREGLDFPSDTLPDYLDFAYFSFVIGMTFQVSDVAISDKTLRRLVLMHALISFVLNTFVVALTINFLAGLSK